MSPIIEGRSVYLYFKIQLHRNNVCNLKIYVFNVEESSQLRVSYSPGIYILVFSNQSGA